MVTRSIRAIIIPTAIRDAIERHVAAAHTQEAGGFLDCVRDGDRLRATRHVPMQNDSSTPDRRFEAIIDERVPTPPRVFYHSHTSPATVSGLTGIDRRSIPEPFALVVFAPHGTPESYRLFRRGLIGWSELAVESGTAGEQTKLPRLV